MEHLMGSSVAVFIGVTVVLFGAASWMTGRAVAMAWQTGWLLLPYSLLLGLGARFLTYALFEGQLFAWRGYAVSTGVIGLVMLIAYRLYHVRQMVQQYPWLYERRGPFAWCDKR
jgi:hypothetical protein